MAVGLFGALVCLFGPGVMMGSLDSGRSSGSAGLRLITNIFWILGSTLGFFPEYWPNNSVASPTLLEIWTSPASGPGPSSSPFARWEPPPGVSRAARSRGIPPPPVTPRGSESTRPGGLQTEDGERSRPMAPSPDEGLTGSRFPREPRKCLFDLRPVFD